MGDIVDRIDEVIEDYVEWDGLSPDAASWSAENGWNDRQGGWTLLADGGHVAIYEYAMSADQISRALRALSAYPVLPPGAFTRISGDVA